MFTTNDTIIHLYSQKFTTKQITAGEVC